MSIIDIIEKKRDKKELTRDEIEFFIKEYTDGKITDYQAAALIMAIYLNGMTKRETTDLTLAMAHSGDILDLSILNQIIVDKHSTGGVGDKVSIILLPIISSLGVPVAKMSGRGLGFTGGTADKLESIPGYKTDIDIPEFVKNVQKIGISMITQTLDLAPADKKIYSLRDSISCVENISLIASSIISKKIASGAQKIVIDVTVGKGAFMKNIEDARKLANEMIQIGKLADRETVCVLTNMDQPLGFSIGNNLEVIEAINCLKGNMPEDVAQVVFELGAYIIKLAGKGDDLEKNKKEMIEAVKDGRAYRKFLELVKNQNGDISYIENTEKFEKAKYIVPVYADESGYISEIDAKEIGKLSVFLGAGREKKEDKIDNSVGIVLSKKISDKVQKQEILAFIHSNDFSKMQVVEKRLKEIFKISNENVDKEVVILEIIK